MKRASFFYRWRGQLGALVAVGVLTYLLCWQRWLLLRDGRGEDFLEFGGVCVALGGHLVRMWALSCIGSISRTTQLRAERVVKEGPYALVRHPLYLGNWLIATGLFVVTHDALLLVVGPLAVLGWYLKISAEEERYLKERFGEEYEGYMRKVPRFFPLRRPRGMEFDIRRAAGFWTRTKEWQALAGTALFVLAREMIELARGLRVG